MHSSSPRSCVLVSWSLEQCYRVPSIMKPMPNDVNPGKSMYSLAQELWPVNRSLSGIGVRETLLVLSEQISGFEVESIETGSKVFDWTVPKEWEVAEAYLITPSGDKICDFAINNLHLVGYSVPFEGQMELGQLQAHLHSLEAQRNAIPYVTSYYEEAWGFCLSQEERDLLEPGIYTIVIKTRLFDGVLNYGELLIRGQSSREVFFSTYICHPSMANNELSGPVLATEIAKWLQSQDSYYSYRFVFIPETIGSLVYMSRNLAAMKTNVVAGFVLTCVGDERTFSYLPSRDGNTVADRVALRALNSFGVEYVRYSWLDRGSDERQYCSPGADLPICSVIRSKYGEYPEYHTSLDTLGGVVTERGLRETFDLFTTILRLLESQRYPRALQVGEPQLGKRGLWPNLSVKGAYSSSRRLADALSLMDGRTELGEIATSLGCELSEIYKLSELLKREGLIEL